ncbi:hypothetical protein GGX14DRAFT_463158 [Mycena pura]|uniref:F-box domain-containing protein n=1 Tax=Mycena pura TaxID=153505 RepID=A0AAD6VBV7_9AGAR|nr:hypothetical protein GGX14DRAFT_463158 [Mycena pura]
MQTQASFHKDSNVQTSTPDVLQRPERSPILEIPPEILSEIFERFVPAYPEWPPLSGILSPLLLCRICRYWREIAMSTPTLWAAIDLSIDNQAEEQQLELLDLWLSRSGSCPLSLSIEVTVRGSPDTMPHPSLSQLLPTIIRHCERWVHIKLVVPLALLHLIRGNMPLLQDLAFGPTHLPPDDAPPPVTIFDMAPQLTKVVLQDCFVPQAIRLPWAQITHLEGLCLYEGECVHILNLAVNLVHCTLCIVCGTEYSPPPTIITLPHLRDFFLVVRDDETDLRKVLNHLALPALDTLHVVEPFLGQDEPPDTRLDVLKNLFSRSECVVRELRVVDPSITESSYREAFPSVKSIIFL